MCQPQVTAWSCLHHGTINLGSSRTYGPKRESNWAWSRMPRMVRTDNATKPAECRSGIAISRTRNVGIVHTTVHLYRFWQLYALLCLVYTPFLDMATLVRFHIGTELWGHGRASYQWPTTETSSNRDGSTDSDGGQACCFAHELVQLIIWERWETHQLQTWYNDKYQCLNTSGRYCSVWQYQKVKVTLWIIDAMGISVSKNTILNRILNHMWMVKLECFCFWYHSDHCLFV